MIRRDAQAIDYYVPDAWNPHCTVAWRLKKNELPEALALTSQALNFPFIATVERLGVVNTPAEVELDCFELCRG